MKREFLFLIIYFILCSCVDGNERKSYYENGKIKSISQMKDSLMHGKHEYYYPSGQLQSRGFYINGRASGIIDHFYESGNLKSHASWKDGKEDGEGKIYFENGKLNFSAFYKQGKIIETSLVYFENGQLKERKLYDSLGNLIHIMTFSQDGKLEKSFVVPYLQASKDTIRVGEQLQLTIKFGLPLSGDISIQASDTDSLGNIFYEEDILRCTAKESVMYVKTFDKAGKYKLSFWFKHSGRHSGDTLSVQNVIRDYSIVVLDPLPTQKTMKDI